MDQRAITTQPLVSSQNTEKPPLETPTMIHGLHNFTPIDYEKGDHTEVTAVFHPDTDHNEEREDDKEKEKQDLEDTSDCCFVCVDSGTSDPWCMFVFCQWIGDCLRGIGQCTEGCFDNCATCLNNCCENDVSCCLDCSCDCADGCGDCFTCCGDCLNCCGDCLDCCAACDS